MMEAGASSAEQTSEMQEKNRKGNVESPSCSGKSDEIRRLTREWPNGDLKWALGLNRLGAELLGVWPSERHAGRSESWNTRLRVPFMMLLLFFWICLPQTWALALVMDDLSLVIDNLMSNVAAFSSCVKLFFLWRNMEAMRPVVESARRDWLGPKSAWKRELMLRNAWSMRLVTVIDYSVTALSVLGFVALPMLDIDFRLINNITDFGDRHLLVQSRYPFDYSKSPYFELCQGLQYAGALFASLSITVPENYFGAHVAHLSSQFQILGLELERSFGGCSAAASETRLRTLIQRQAHLVAMIRAVERSFTYVTLAQVLCTSVILCSYGFQILAIFGASDQRIPFLQMLALLCIMSTMMLHTLVDCLAGENLAMQSTGLIDSIYKCHWYADGGKRARDLIPMMILSRNQKPLTAGKILPLSLSTYSSILKTTAGYISMLVAVNAK